MVLVYKRGYQDTMLVVNSGSVTTPIIVDHLKRLGHKPEVVQLHDLELRHLEAANGVIFGGSMEMLSEQPPSFLEHYAFIREATVPMLGICFGHQLLGKLHGAEIKKTKQDASWLVGQRNIWLENHSLFDGLNSITPFLQYHAEEISLPNDFFLLASSDETMVEAMCHKTKPIYSIQFHPELSGPVGFKFFQNFSKLCKDQKRLLMH